MSDIKKALSATAKTVEAELDRLLAQDGAPERRVVEAMRYASLGGGKRIRPFLVLESAKLFGVTERSAIRVASALEMVHCYSLVHDDLPAMDDDDQRRGRPTVHKRYDEATAILAGDALLTAAFAVLANSKTHSDPGVRCELVEQLAQAAGAHGMVGGQMIDLTAAQLDLDIGGVTRLQRLKTGRLIDFGCQAGAILGRSGPNRREALRGYSHDLGLAFQMIDDILDVEGNPDLLGKAVAKDEGQGKATFVSLMGVERARSQADRLADQAAAHLASFDERADGLRALARFVVERDH